MGQDDLAEEEIRTVTEALTAAEDSIRPLAENARADARADAARLLDRIASKARQASNVEKHFGLAVADLLALKPFGFPDAGIVDGYYASRPHPDGARTWSAVLSKYRGDVIHDGYIPFSEASRDPADAARVVMHLHDVATRVVLKILGYDGRYRSRMSPSSAKSVDWVNAASRPEDLGYG